jgi:hypothetical protein
VISATASNVVPLNSGGFDSRVVPEGVAVETGKELWTAYYPVTPHLFRTLNVPIVAGRDFEDADEHPRADVAIVNRTLANRLWPGRTDVVGNRFRLLDDDKQPPLTVVGVVGDFRMFVQTVRPEPYAFIPFPNKPVENTGLTIRVAGRSPAVITAAVRSEIRKSDPTLALFNVRTGEQVRELAYWGDPCSGGCSRSSAPSRLGSRRSASTAFSRMPCRSGVRKSASAWRSARAGGRSSVW